MDLVFWKNANGSSFLGRYVNWQRWIQMYSFFKLITRSTNPCVIASMSMFYLSSGYIEGLMAGYAALAVLTPRLVSPFINFCWLTAIVEVSFIIVSIMNMPICFSFSVFCFLYSKSFNTWKKEKHSLIDSWNRTFFFLRFRDPRIVNSLYFTC